MKPLVILLAPILGKLIQYGAYALLTHLYGPKVMDIVLHGVKQHQHTALLLLGVVLVLLAVWILRKVFDKRKGTPLPIEDSTSVIVEE
jgi:hypothetical protein